MSEAVLSQPKSATAAEPSRLAPKRRSLAAKLAIALVGLITLVLLINGGANLWLNYDDAKRAILGVQLEKAQAAAERVDGFISDVENQIGWTTRAEWRRVPVEQQRYDLIRLLRQAPAVTEVSYLDPLGKEQLKVSRLEMAGSIVAGNDVGITVRNLENCRHSSGVLGGSVSTYNLLGGNTTWNLDTTDELATDYNYWNALNCVDALARVTGQGLGFITDEIGTVLGNCAVAVSPTTWSRLKAAYGKRPAGGRATGSTAPEGRH